MLIDKDDPRVKAFLEKFGGKDFLDENGKVMEIPDSGNQSSSGMFVLNEGEPTLYGHDPDEYMQDPSRIMQITGDDGKTYWIYEAGNIKPGEVAGYQRQSETDRREEYQKNAMIAAALAIGGYGLSGGFEGLLGPEALGGAGGVESYAASDLFGAAGVPEGLTTGAAGTNLGTYGGMTTGLDGGLVNTVASTGVNAAAGTIPTAAANAGWSIPGWNALSPGAQRVILSGLSTGASAMINTRNAERAIDAANSRQQDQQDYETETRERRGRPPSSIAPVRARPIPGGFAASGGLADKYMTPRGG